MNKKLLKKIGLISIGLFCAWGLVLGFYLKKTYSLLSTAYYTQASQSAKTSKFLIKPISVLTFHQIAEIEMASEGLDIVIEIPNIISQTEQFLNQATNNSPASPAGGQLTANSSQPNNLLIQEFTNLLHKVEKIDKLCDKSLVNKAFKFQQCNNVTIVSKYVPDLKSLISYITDKQLTYIILLQNTNELRATGGFMGSYARITLDHGNLTDVDIQDIYEPDGQFTGFVEAPPGVNEYLSSGNGLRLPDANWHPDFPMASQQILEFFAVGNEHSIDGVISLNLSTVEKIFGVTGGIELPDYGVIVTKDNLADIARADRETFFPGSQQKSNFLNSLFNQLKYRSSNLDQEQKKEIAKIILDSFTTKDIMIYSTDEKVENLCKKLNVSGQLDTKRTTHNAQLIYLLESNVGINKANEFITREVNIEDTDYRTTINVNIINNSSEDTYTYTNPLHYVNYQRLITNLENEFHQIVVGDKQLETWNENIITNSEGQEFKQIGFLVEVRAGETNNLTIELTKPTRTTHNAQHETLNIIKQPGLPPTPYSVTIGGEKHEFLLESDVSL